VRARKLAPRRPPAAPIAAATAPAAKADAPAASSQQTVLEHHSFARALLPQVRDIHAPSLDLRLERFARGVVLEMRLLQIGALLFERTSTGIKLADLALDCAAFRRAIFDRA
jgi:hypothetical protein